ncbi:hypothetical protein A0H81_02000 [Grifola frondosa]|uniref:Uncharacterized protein n=1 Tax=Grifola frondosa TaxID=5627 RepID=A0A1C7MPU6_GRIFR|nr:hypothetical protein A0H81_02000 [Grifola frondosa]
MDAQHLRYIIDHVFAPPKLPQGSDYAVTCEETLALFVLQSAIDFQSHLSADGSQRWVPMVKLLLDLRNSAEIQSLRAELIERQIANMDNGGVVAYYIRAQNAAIIIRNLSHATVFESFEVSPTSAAVMETKGKLLCSYPGPAIAISHDVINDSSFRESLANFLSRMNEDILDAAPMTQKAKSHVVEERDTSHPRYITEFLTGVLRGMGTEADVPRIRKRVGDNVLWNNVKLPWRRSPLWLVIRVALQTSLRRRSGCDDDYKSFIVFFLAKIILKALEQGLSNDLLFCMRAKMSRRLYKLGSAAPTFLECLVSEVAGKVECRMTEIWTSVQSYAVHSMSPYWKPNELNLADDTHLSLTNSCAHLSRVLTQSLPAVSTSSFQPHHSPRLTTFAQFISNDRSKLSEACQSNPHLTLADFEACVEKSLSDWLRVVVDVNSACLAVADCMDQYWGSRGIYAGNQENMSLMFLTLLELWVALDKLALRDCSLLHEYSPEIPEALFEALLLRKSSDLVRLKLAIQYLRARHRQAMRSTFTDNVDRDTFAVRFCATSKSHRQLKLRIENQAARDKEAKARELEEKNQLYSRLTQELRDTSHTYIYNRRGQLVHRGNGCACCRLEQRIQALNIDVFEWPLPENTLTADVVVFELQCPTAYNAWRTATYIFLHDMCTPPQHSASNTANASTLLANYHPLQPYWIQPRNARVVLASETRSFLSTHYRNTPIPSNEGQVCVNNGLRFRLFDCSNSSWATKAFTRCDLASHCTFTLPPGPYQCLQYAIAGTSHTSNDIIANQIDCSKDLTLHEFMSFGVLRSGPLLQWLNILRELRANILTFRREEVHALLMQAAWQVGPLSQDGDPEWHVELANVEFGFALLSELRDLLLGVEANWQEVMTVRTVIALICRLLASSSDADVVKRAFDLLREARRVSFGWLQELSKKVQESDDKEVKEFQDRVCEMAAVCRSTFDVDSRHILEMFRSAEDIMIVVECAIVLHDNRSPNDTSLPSHLKALLDRDRRAARSFEPFLREHILGDRSGLDRAISAIWSAYRPGTSWRQLQHPNERWLTSQTAASVAQTSQIVHYDLVGGELLINGKPLGRLPSNILTNPLYGLVFGSKVLDIVPGSMPGTEYATRGEIDGYQFHFGFRSGTELVIRATRGATILELVPRETFIGDLPHSFVHDHIHWQDIRTGAVELRPTIDKWNSSPKNWNIYFSPNGHSFMRREDATLVDICSRTYEMLAKRLEPLESKDRIIISCRGEQPGTTLSVDMPRFGLSFFVDKNNELQSRNMRNMVVDSDQSTGTMIGLRNQLVLRPADPITMKLALARCVLIPVGSVSFSQMDHHVSVEIDTGSDSRVQFQQYRIDDTLGRLVGNVSLANKLYKIYLHALTSHCLPDLLAGRTGTEEALHDLHSAGCWSFQSLTDVEEDLLEKIGSLTPVRKCYPEHLRVMQQTIWSNLSPLSQHHEYYSVTRAILEYADRLRVFTEDAKLSSRTSRLDSSLLERAALRNCVYYPAEFAYPPSNAADVEYHSRDQFIDTGATNESAVYNTARTVYEWPQRLNTCHEIFDKLRMWNSIAGPGTNSGLTLQYGSHWLKMDMANAWLSLYNLCRLSERLSAGIRSIRYHICITTISPPDFDSYTLSEGCEPNVGRLQRIIENATLSFEESPEATLQAMLFESTVDFGKRRYSTYKEQCRIQQSNFVQYLVGQWPCNQPGRPSASYNTRFNIVKAMNEAEAAFGSWYRNRALRDHVSQVEAILRQVHSPTPYIRNPSPHRFVPCSEHRLSSTTVISINALFTRREIVNIDSSPPNLPTISRIGQERLRGSGKIYGNNLAISQRTLQQETVDAYPEDIPFTSKYLADHYTQCKNHLDRVVGAIVRSLSPSSTLEEIMFTTCLWPRLTITSLLRSLGSLSGINLTAEWKRALIALANAVISVQRAQRLLGFALGHQRDEFFKELKNMNCDGWDPSLYPDWLLVQIDGHFIVRSIQSRRRSRNDLSNVRREYGVAAEYGRREIICDRSGYRGYIGRSNETGTVVVLKSLANSMFQMLVDRLSGLTNRRIFYMPFSRAINPDVDQVRVIQNLYEECMRVGGILVTQPDHILSFKLMAIDRQLSANDSTSRPVTDQLLES